MVATANTFEQGSEDGDFCGVFGFDDFDALFLMVTPEAGLLFFHVGENGGFRFGKIEDPSMCRVDIVRFFEPKFFEFREREA